MARSLASLPCLPHCGGRCACDKFESGEVITIKGSLSLCPLCTWPQRPREESTATILLDTAVCAAATELGGRVFYTDRPRSFLFFCPPPASASNTASPNCRLVHHLDAHNAKLQRRRVTMARGNQRERDRMKAQAKEAKKGGKSKEGCPRARQER